MQHRTFIAAYPSDEGIEACLRLQEVALAQMEGNILRPLPPANLHLTLVFVGNVEDGPLGRLIDAFSAERFDRIEALLGRLATMPPRGAPQSVHVTVKGDQSLGTVQVRMATLVVQLGHAIDARPFHPHITIGYLKRSSASRGHSSVRAAIARLSKAPTAPIRFAFDRISLVTSLLKPGGAEHREVASLPVG